MLCHITYSKANEHHHLEWFAPSDWSERDIRNAFQRRYPTAQLISLRIA